VLGEYNAHVYVSCESRTGRYRNDVDRVLTRVVRPSKALRVIIDELVARAQTLCPIHTFHSFITPDADNQTQHSKEGSAGTPFKSDAPPTNLHISLTHPLPLRRAQTTTFQSDLTHALSMLGNSTQTSGGAFRLSLAGVQGYMNGRRTGGEGSGGRAFLALRVGAGSQEVCGVG
jgi:hypothetical protein